jgi:hypothetical protein
MLLICSRGGHPGGSGCPLLYGKSAHQGNDGNDYKLPIFFPFIDSRTRVERME